MFCFGKNLFTANTWSEVLLFIPYLKLIKLIFNLKKRIAAKYDFKFPAINLNFEDSEKCDIYSSEHFLDINVKSKNQRRFTLMKIKF